MAELYQGPYGLKAFLDAVEAQYLAEIIASPPEDHAAREAACQRIKCCRDLHTLLEAAIQDGRDAATLIEHDIKGAMNG